MALGLPLSLPKADDGRYVTWTSGMFTATSSFSTGMRVWLLVQVKPDTVAGVLEIALRLLKTNIGTLKELRSYAGKCTAIASVIFT